MIRKVSYLALGVAIGAATATFSPQVLLTVAPSAYAAAADTYRQLNLFGDVFEKIRTDYVEKPDEPKLIEAAINGMLSSLDPHSSYMDAKAYRDMQVQTKGEFGGLGIEVTEEDGAIKVVTPIDDTPASKAGIMSGDIIVGIDDDSVQGLTLDQAVDKMRGAVNSAIRLKIIRGSAKEPKEFKIVRDVIRVQSVRSHVEDDDIGYIRITQFTEQTADGLKSAMEKFRGEVPADMRVTEIGAHVKSGPIPESHRSRTLHINRRPIGRSAATAGPLMQAANRAHLMINLFIPTSGMRNRPRPVLICSRS